MCSYKKIYQAKKLKTMIVFYKSSTNKLIYYELRIFVFANIYVKTSFRKPSISYQFDIKHLCYISLNKKIKSYFHVPYLKLMNIWLVFNWSRYHTRALPWTHSLHLDRLWLRETSKITGWVNYLDFKTRPLL